MMLLADTHAVHEDIVVREKGWDVATSGAGGLSVAWLVKLRLSMTLGYDMLCVGNAEPRLRDRSVVD